MSTDAVPVAITIGYMAAVGLISLAIRRSAASAAGFTEGGRFPAVLVGVLMVSEFIGTAVSVGTAQLGYVSGISAAWNVAALAVGFALFGIVLARKYRQLGINTISGVLASRYGEPTRIASSFITICALQIISVSIYASSGAVLSAILGVGQGTAVVTLAFATVFYVAVGGMRAVVYTNVVHAAVKYLGLGIAVAFGIGQAGGMQALMGKLPPAMLAWDTVGWGQIGAWVLAGIGSIFATQQVVQAIHTTRTAEAARRASFYCAGLMVPFGLGAALVGMTVKVLHPGINPLSAFPSLILDMDRISASVVVAGLAASLFGAVSAASLGTATLFVRDFYEPLFNQVHGEGKSLAALRIAAIVFGLAPMLLALGSTHILGIAYLGKALRSSLAVLVLLAFYAPGFGTRGAAFVGLVGSLAATMAWYLLGNPFGIDNAYVAAATPLAVMGMASAVRSLAWRFRPGRCSASPDGGLRDAPKVG